MRGLLANSFSAEYRVSRALFDTVVTLRFIWNTSMTDEPTKEFIRAHLRELELATNQ
jgi:hypothetical protein